jgi:hypothetical protein
MSLNGLLRLLAHVLLSTSALKRSDFLTFFFQDRNHINSAAATPINTNSIGLGLDHRHHSGRLSTFTYAPSFLFEMEVVLLYLM